MEGIVLRKKNLNGQRPRVDRFIPPRETFLEMRKKFVWGHQRHQGCAGLDNKQRKFVTNLNATFGLEEPGGVKNPDWPCIPRKEYYLSLADSILDLPNYSQASIPDILDWNSDNVLVAALGRHYHKWSWGMQSCISRGFAWNSINCCKFDPWGQLLLLGCSLGSVELHDNGSNKLTHRSECPCVKTGTGFCYITTLDWSPTGNSFVTGCDRGRIVSYTREGSHISHRRPRRQATFIVRVSPDARFVAVAGMGHEVRNVLILTWPSLESHSTYKSVWIFRTLSWHPWCSAQLVVGSVSACCKKPHITTWGTHSCKTREVTLNNSSYSLDAMQFSSKTGELVVSLWDADRAASDPKSCTKLIVMSDLKTVVDEWGEGRFGLDRIRSMVFSPDGTKLATATEEEDLIIWNFLPEDKKSKKVKCRRHSALPVYLDEASQGYSLR